MAPIQSISGFRRQALPCHLVAAASDDALALITIKVTSSSTGAGVHAASTRPAARREPGDGRARFASPSPSGAPNRRAPSPGDPALSSSGRDTGSLQPHAAPADGGAGPGRGTRTRGTPHSRGAPIAGSEPPAWAAPALTVVELALRPAVISDRCSLTNKILLIFHLRLMRSFRVRVASL